MIQVRFKNLEKSELATQIAKNRICEAIERFPKGKPRAVVVTLGMENSPQHPGPDVFTVKTEVIGGKYHGLILEKSAGELYAALAEVTERLLERFNRYSDRLRVKALRQQRRFAAKYRGKLLNKRRSPKDATQD